MSHQQNVGVIVPVGMLSVNLDLELELEERGHLGIGGVLEKFYSF